MNPLFYVASGFVPSLARKGHARSWDWVQGLIDAVN